MVQPHARRMYLAAALVGGCTTRMVDESGTSGADTATSSTDTDTDTDTTVTGDGPAFTSGPTLTQSPAPEAPLGWQLTASFDVPVTVTVTASDDTGSWSFGPFPQGTDVSAWLHGWHPGRAHTVVITATDAGGRTSTETLALTPPPLPDDFPDLRLVSSDPSRMEPGVTLLAPSRSPGGASYLVAVDALGLPVWWYAGSGSIHAITQTPEGHIRLMRNRDGVYEIDLRGGIVTEWHPTGASLNGVTVDTAALHHDLIPLPNGHLLALSVEGRDLDDYPLSETNLANTGPAFVAGDVLVEFDPSTGAVLRALPLLDHLDPHRVAWDGVKGDYWEDFFGGDTKDWSHGNALRYDPATDLVWVSLRHQDAIVAVKLATGAIEAILGPHDNWDPAFGDRLLTLTGGSWQYHQHGHDFGPGGTILTFDNGNNRTSPPVSPTAPTTSRAVEYAVDLTLGTASQVWEFSDPRGLFSGSLGNVQHLPETDHVLVDYGNITGDPEGAGVRVFEVTHTTPAEVVFELGAWPVEEGGGVTAYRAHRWPSLQPIPGE